MGSNPWFYVEGGQQRGPVAAEELAQWILRARLPPDVPVWRAGLDQWTSAEALPEIVDRVLPAGFFLASPAGPQGPLAPRALAEMARSGRLGRETLVWREGLPDWITAGAVPELAPWMSAPPPSPAVPPPAPPRRPAPKARGLALALDEPAPTVEDHRPEVDRDGPCPLCGQTDKMGMRARKIYDVWACGRCRTNFTNRRQGAWALDVLAMVVPMFAIGFVLGIVSAATGTDIEPLTTLATVGIYVLFLLKDGLQGRSPGKALLGLRVWDEESGAPAGFLASFKRNLPLLIPFVPLVAALQVGSGPRVGDGWAHTRVVWEKHRGRGPF